MGPDQNNIHKIRHTYDLAAEDYAKACFDELDDKPFDRSVLERFAQLTSGRGKVCDIGCGPGEVACYLKKCGADVMGIDISHEMISLALKLTPGIEFMQGDMFSLPFEDSALAGMTAFYAIVNYGIDSVGRAFSEFFRVLAEGGFLLVAFHIGDNKVFEVRNFFNTNNDLDYCYFDPDDIISSIKGAGFEIEEAVVRYPYKKEYPTKRAYILAHK
jgi:ubiquinone/menaquinone biosynthesis C-methylase UbiE